MKSKASNSTGIIISNLFYLSLSILFFFLGWRLYRTEHGAGVLVMLISAIVAICEIGDTILRIFGIDFKEE